MPSDRSGSADPDPHRLDPDPDPAAGGIATPIVAFFEFIHGKTPSLLLEDKLQPNNQTSGARSRLYRRRFLQVNTRWKALAEIYTKHSFAPFSNLNFFVKNRHFFCD